jgi:hypothetical protein
VQLLNELDVGPLRNDRGRRTTHTIFEHRDMQDKERLVSCADLDADTITRAPLETSKLPAFQGLVVENAQASRILSPA